MKKIIFGICTLCLAEGILAEEKPYDIALIQPEIKKNAHSVIREERIEFEVKSIARAAYRVHKVVTVLNENGKRELIFAEDTDQFHSLENASIQYYDAKGNLLKKYKRSDLSKQAIGSGLVPGGQLFYLEFPSPNYPLTMVVDYEIKYDGLLDYPDYQVQSPEQAIQSSTFKAIVPAELDLRYKAKNTGLLPVASDDGKLKTYTWTVNNLPALEYEAGSVSDESRYPHILLSPNKFELDGYAGDMSTWQNYGKWYGTLSKGANNLSAEKTRFFQELVKDAANDREKTRIIYSYLQANCRYVLIALGIGGFKPFDADFVDKKKYGDCKALSNYMQACLSAVGIQSYQALINASYNKEPVDPLFPHHGFNHVIVCVPLKQDTVWLECTNNLVEFGKLGNFTENRNALLITEDGGKLVPTPTSKATENQFSANTTVNLDADGSGLIQVALNTSGEFKFELVSYLTNLDKDDLRKFLVNYMGFIQPDDFEINYDRAAKASAATIRLAMEKVPQFSAGKKLFLNPRMYKIWSDPLPNAENRTQDYYFEHPFVKTDSTIYIVPEGFEVEILPKDRKLSFEFGSFETHYKFDRESRRIISFARLELQQYKIPAAKFMAAKKFFNEVLNEYTEKIVVKRP